MENTRFKIIILGTETVEKTSLIKEISQKHRIDKKELVGVYIQDYVINKQDTDYHLNLWDLKAEEKFEFLYRKFFRGAAAAILIFNPSDPKTFEYCTEQLASVRKNVRNICPFILIANHLKEEEDVNETKYIQYAKDEGAISYIALKENKTDGFKEALNMVLDILIDLSTLDMLTNDINIKMVMLLSLYNELSLAELANYIGKSKATISRYTRSLIRLGILNTYSKKDEVTPGSIDKKYYALNAEFIYNPEILSYESFDVTSGREISKLNYELRKKIFLFSLYGELNQIWQSFMKSFPKGREGLIALTFLALQSADSSENYINIINTILQTSMNLHFITEEQYAQIQSLKEKYKEKFNEILSNDKGKQRKYVYIDMVLPFLQLMNIEKPDHENRIETIKSLSKEFEKKF